MRKLEELLEKRKGITEEVRRYRKKHPDKIPYALLDEISIIDSMIPTHALIDIFRDSDKSKRWRME